MKKTKHELADLRESKIAHNVGLTAATGRPCATAALSRTAAPEATSDLAARYTASSLRRRSASMQAALSSVNF